MLYGDRETYRRMLTESQMLRDPERLLSGFFIAQYQSSPLKFVAHLRILRV